MLRNSGIKLRIVLKTFPERYAKSDIVHRKKERQIFNKLKKL